MRLIMLKRSTLMLSHYSHPKNRSSVVLTFMFYTVEFPEKKKKELGSQNTEFLQNTELEFMTLTVSQKELHSDFNFM